MKATTNDGKALTKKKKRDRQKRIKSNEKILKKIRRGVYVVNLSEDDTAAISRLLECLVERHNGPVPAADFHRRLGELFSANSPAVPLLDHYGLSQRSWGKRSHKFMALALSVPRIWIREWPPLGDTNPNAVMHLRGTDLFYQFVAPRVETQSNADVVAEEKKHDPQDTSAEDTTTSSARDPVIAESDTNAIGGVPPPAVATAESSTSSTTSTEFDHGLAALSISVPSSSSPPSSDAQLAIPGSALAAESIELSASSGVPSAQSQDTDPSLDLGAPPAADSAAASAMPSDYFKDDYGVWWQVTESGVPVPTGFTESTGQVAVDNIPSAFGGNDDQTSGFQPHPGADELVMQDSLEEWPPLDNAAPAQSSAPPSTGSSHSQTDVNAPAATGLQATEFPTPAEYPVVKFPVYLDPQEEDSESDPDEEMMDFRDEYFAAEDGSGTFDDLPFDGHNTSSGNAPSATHGTIFTRILSATNAPSSSTASSATSASNETTASVAKTIKPPTSSSALGSMTGHSTSTTGSASEPGPSALANAASSRSSRSVSPKKRPRKLRGVVDRTPSPSASKSTSSSSSSSSKALPKDQTAVAKSGKAEVQPEEIATSTESASPKKKKKVSFA